jgi:RND family efflux transporter MFP subunit
MRITQNFRNLRPAVRYSLMVGLVAVALAGWGISSRMLSQAALNAEAQAESAQPAVLIKPTTGGGSDELILPGTLMAYIDAPIYARTNGYLKRWVADIGTRVKTGQLIAEIDTPEIDQQAIQAEADLKTAEANNDLAQLTANRWRGLLATNSVSKQDADNKIGDAAAKAAALASAQANLNRLHELQAFKRIVAPFDGVITARNVDVGDLIDAGSGSGKAKELFHEAAIQRLRVYVQVPESQAHDMQVGSMATLMVREHPGKLFPAKLVSTANAIDPTSHTLLVQLEADNASRELLPGGYAEVHFKLPMHADVLRVPANALLFGRNGMQVAIVGDDNRAVLQTVTIGRDLGKEVEILAGLKADQRIIINPPDSLVTGQAIKPVVTAPKGPDAK